MWIKAYHHTFGLLLINFFPIRKCFRYAGISTCFRQEVGSHGRDTRGMQDPP